MDVDGCLNCGIEQPGLEEETVHDAKVLISRRYDGGGSRFGSCVC